MLKLILNWLKPKDESLYAVIAGRIKRVTDRNVNQVLGSGNRVIKAPNSKVAAQIAKQDKIPPGTLLTPAKQKAALEALKKGKEAQATAGRKVAEAVKKPTVKKQDAPAAATETKASKAAKVRAERKAKRAADKKRAEEKAEKLRNQRAEAQKKREAKAAKEKEAAATRAARESDEIQAGTTVIVKGAKKSPYSRREATKPKGTETQVRRPAGSKDPKTGEPRGGQLPKSKEAGAPGSKTRKAAAAAVKAKRDSKILGGILGTGAVAGVVGALLSDKDEDKKKGKKKTVVTTSPDNVGPLRPDRITPKDKPPITNKELGAHYNRINTLIEAENKGAGTYGIKYEGKEYRNWKEYNKAWEKENKGRDKPEDPIKSFFKGAKKKSTVEKKRGGGQVSSRPKSYRTAKIMKQYAKGGSVRKPNRI